MSCEPGPSGIPPFLLPLLVLCGCSATGTDAAVPPPQAVPEAVRPGGESVVYHCGDRRVTARFEGQDVLFQRAPDPPRRLSTTLSASGARYAGPGIVFWTKRDEALLEIEGEGTVRCRRQDAPIRAVGQEPGWLLEITPGGRMAFTGDYGEIRVSAAAPPPEAAPDRRTVYRAGPEARGLTAVFEDRPCQDVMSGSLYPTTVTVTLDGRTHRGCGDGVPPER